MAAARRQLLDPVAESEIRVIERAFRAKNIFVETEPDPAGQGVDFSYQKDVLLVRREYLADVVRIAAPPGGRHWAPDVRDVAREVALLPLHGSRFAGQDEGGGDDGGQRGEPARRDAPGRPAGVLLALDEIDQRLGAGAATPNHVLTVCGPLPPVVPCMATEPEEVSYGAGPEPPPHHGRRGERVRVYLADTGLLDGAVDSHPWLHGVHGDPEDKVDPDDIRPYAGHGTFAAGVARCTAPGIELYCANVFNIAGSALESDAVGKLTAALGQGYDIFNLTVSTSSRQSLPLLSFDAWRAELARHRGVACVVAAGNNGSYLPFWPAAFPGMIAVGALDQDWRGRADFSNYGKWVDVYAPGSGLVNAWAHGRYRCYVPPDEGTVRHFHGMARCSGTSFATPIVTGRIARRMSATGETAAEAAAALLAAAHTVPGVGPVLLP